MRRAIAVAAVTALSAAGLAGGAAAAFADTGGDRVAAAQPGVVRVLETYTYRSPSTEFHPALTLKQNTPVLVTCWTKGQQVHGDDLWYRVAADNVVTFAPPRSVKVLTDPWSIPQCGTG
ncbi:hypothetical protein [Nakamurella deserti]|uniref:hypothetical protein n=1 Tax=Nakamurella deserti TaxID=2164074 RepID=UPI000DBE61C1|nr:hypothetical protein [Nakamurella deserti]